METSTKCCHNEPWLRSFTYMNAPEFASRIPLSLGKNECHYAMWSVTLTNNQNYFAPATWPLRVANGQLAVTVLLSGRLLVQNTNHERIVCWDICRDVFLQQPQRVLMCSENWESKILLWIKLLCEILIKNTYMCMCRPLDNESLQTSRTSVDLLRVLHAEFKCWGFHFKEALQNYYLFFILMEEHHTLLNESGHYFVLYSTLVHNFLMSNN